MTTVITLGFPTSLRYLNVIGAAITAACERHGELARAAAGEIELAVQELCVNIVRHAHDGGEDGRIDIEMKMAEHAFIFDVYDAGRSFEGAAAQAPPSGELQEHGYGLFLMNQLMDEVSYERLGERNHWRLVKRLPAPGGGE